MQSKSIHLFSQLCDRCAQEDKLTLGLMVSLGKEVVVDVIELCTEWDKEARILFVKEKVRFPCKKCGTTLFTNHQLYRIPLSTVKISYCDKCGSRMVLENFKSRYTEKPVQELDIEAIYACEKCSSKHSLSKKIKKSLNTVKSFEIGPSGIKLKR